MRTARKSAFTLILVLLSLLAGLPLSAQSKTGELRLKISDPQGLGVHADVALVSEANDYRSNFATDDAGAMTAKRLPFGIYRVSIQKDGFAPVSQVLEVRSALPTSVTIKLGIASVNTLITVQGGGTLIDPDQAGASNVIGADTIQNRVTSLPGRSLQDLVNTQPGWLYEGNAVLHPRGSEYQTQLIVDGIPLTDNRSPSFGPEIEADDIDSMNIYTAGIPAEYGRKMGGVIEVNTQRNAQKGFHGQAVLSGGSFDTAGAFAQVQYARGNNVFGASASGSMTDHYLNPVVPENFTNRGTIGDFSLSFERDLTPKDRITLSVRHELSRYEIPNEQIQQNPQLQDPAPPLGTPSQLQTAGNFETVGMVAYEHIFSQNVLIDLRGMVRDNADNLDSNAFSWPVEGFLRNDFKDGYFKAAISVHHGRHEFKAGVDSDVTYLHENFRDRVTVDPNDANNPFDPDTPTTFSFLASRPDLEQAAFVQDVMHLGNWLVSGGLRWDHYQLLVNQNAVSPRLSIARNFPAAGLMVHFSYDRVFQTPSNENILLASSPLVQSLNEDVLRLPVEPSHGNYFEVGASKSFWGQLRFDGDYFRRYVNNYADDDQILSTAVSFPIAFRKAVIYGAEAKIELPHWKKFSGFASYSYIVGNSWFPVTGGLFLGDDAVSATTQLVGHFPDSQDQRNTARLRVRYDVTHRLWFATGGEYGSGLPFEFTGDFNQALTTYGQAVVNRINFDRGRIKPLLSINASMGVDLWEKEGRSLRLQADGQNLNDRLNVIDFGGLFSGNAIGPPRSYALRLTAAF
jgi:outer membrane receptor for Fe3+-dicitrate